VAGPTGTALETKGKKSIETESHSPLATVYACTFPSGRFPAKFGCQPIKLKLYPLAHTYPANYVRACTSGNLGYIKRAEQHIESFGLGLFLFSCRS